MTERSVFEPNLAHKLCDTVPGVDASLLADLYDCVSKFGSCRQDRRMRSLSSDGPPPLHVAVVVDPPGNLNMNVARSPGGILKNRVKTVLLSDGRSAVFWDSDVTAEEVRRLIRTTDEEMRGIGFEDGGRVRRRVVRDDDRPGPYLVDEVFRDRETVYALPPGVTPEEFRSNFDRPELLHPVKLGDGSYGFVHAANRRMVRLADITAEVLAGHGIKDPQEFAALPKAVQQRLMAEIAALLRQMDN